MASDKSETTEETAEGDQCPMCPAGTLQEGITTLTLERGEAVIVFKKVPADVCDVCGEAYVDEEVSAAVHEKAETEIKDGAQLDVRQYDTSAAATA